MNDFTSPHERSIGLPEGCKDLLDVLLLEKTLTEKSLKQQNLRAKGFSDIEPFMWRMLEPAPGRRHLSIHCWQNEEKHLVSFIRPKGVLHVIMLLRAESAQEHAMRSILQSEGILPTQDAVTGDPGSERRFLLFPVSRVAPQVARLVAEILRKVYGLQENAELEFAYRVGSRSSR